MSLTDWDDKVSAVLFLGGCNYRCPYCHNWQIVESPDGVDDVPLDEVKAYLKESASWLDGVVITGGEPTQDPELLTLAAYIKSLGLQVKLDTNGSEPDVLEELIGRHLVDYIAMDVKNSFGKYAETVGTLPDLDDVKKSIEIVMDFAAHEFRTTVVPDLVEEEDIVKICGYLRGAQRYILQRYHPENVLNKEYAEIMPQRDDEMEHLVSLCEGKVPVTWRG
ncbi:MAG: anaerobic ribonucleoside-triphosphate reductase activating protein [Candidatus Methanofastidiosa archaeon]|jgi:pyruvate formate lyase activating enzyme|nr:anaerobic ribonucleoside-triphosphate reductase activating protein [Candidatus Methanofastidiosa archaeon]